MKQREIKFRAISPVNTDEPKVMQYYDLSRIDDLERFSRDDWAISQLMQFTGLLDKNKVEIFELHEINNKYRVVFSFNRYILQHISNRDINLEFEADGQYEITGEYSPIQEN